ncbi:expressed unknown protein [Seminavis robusta]|uniref:Nudix hydrolase domain-containing protein n=1 Tax=Seminavis robusta TaxID=568900 RepID=A0A9N8DVB6_9STRA|nr:expressed unknown protein [Seminavis robusta]|eukprot:Sro320_g116490.1 n/a (245) ;mRNA; r:26438-27172
MTALASPLDQAQGESEAAVFMPPNRLRLKFLFLLVVNLWFPATSLSPRCQHRATTPPRLFSCSSDKDWTTLHKFTTLSTPWMALHGEKLLDDKGQQLDYWRVEKEDSAIVVSLTSDEFLLPEPSFRPGVGRCTLDFPGGRIPANTDLTGPEVAAQIVQRELGISDDSIVSIAPINEKGWPINSSFSNQLLYGFLAVLDLSNDTVLSPGIRKYSTSAEGMEALLEDLECLQCRMVLLEWMRRNNS